MGRHLTPEEVETGNDWAAMQNIAVLYRTAEFFEPAIRSLHRRNSSLIAIGMLALSGLHAQAAPIRVIPPSSQTLSPILSYGREQALKNLIWAIYGDQLAGVSPEAPLDKLLEILPNRLDVLNELFGTDLELARVKAAIISHFPSSGAN